MYGFEYDHDANGNGIAEESEYIQVATSSDGAFPDADYSGSYNDYANSGLKGKVSLWVECYDLAETLSMVVLQGLKTTH